VVRFEDRGVQFGRSGAARRDDHRRRARSRRQSEAESEETGGALVEEHVEAKRPPLSRFSQGDEQGGRPRARARYRVGHASTHPLVDQDTSKGGLDVVGREGRHWGKIALWPKIPAWPKITV
jgi:hypothetical protein